MPLKFSKNQEDTICNLYISGIGSYLIASKFECNPTTVRNILKRHLIHTRRRDVSHVSHMRKDLVETEICNAYNDGFSIEKIAMMQKCSMSPIRRILKKHGIKFRSKYEGNVNKILLKNESRICDDYLAGSPTSALAIKFSCSKETIRGILKRHNIDRVWKFTPEAINNMRLAAIHRIKTNPSTWQMPSKSCASFLNKVENLCGVKFEREFELGGRFFDGKINSILVEVDGHFWHKSDESRRIDALKAQIAEKNKFYLYRFEVNSMADVDDKIDEYAAQLKEIFNHGNRR